MNNASKLTKLENEMKALTAEMNRLSDEADYAGARKLNRKLDGLYERYAVLNSGPDQRV